MSTISVYTYCTNAIRDEFFIIEGIKSALLFADEVIVIDGESKDNTINRIKKINSNRIKIYTNKWLDSLGKSMGALNRSISIGSCTSDWCILMDADEVFHEEDIARIKKIPESVSDNIVAVEFNALHFYKDYKHVINGCPDWKDLYDHKIYMVRNGLSIHHGSIGMEPDGHVDINGQPIPHERRLLSNIRMFHFGHARTKEAYIRKCNRINGRHKGWRNYTPLNEDTFEWIPEWKLRKYTGTLPLVMKERISVGLDSHKKIVELYK